MRHMRWLAILVLVPALALLAGPGCSKKEDKKGGPPEEKKGSASGEPKKGEEAKKGDGAVSKGDRQPLGGTPDGVLKGTITYDGDPPKMAAIAAQDAHKDCKIGGDWFERGDQTWIVNPKNKGVANAVIFLSIPKNKYFELKEEDKNRKDPVVIDQPHCAFIPHVSAYYPAYFDGKTMQKSGQKLIIKNSASFTHNTKWTETLKNPGQSLVISPKGEQSPDFVPQTTPIDISCDIHSFMTGKIWVFEHPYFAVTDLDGKFEIKNVPAGVEVNVVLWHEGVNYPSAYGGKAGSARTFMSGENKLDFKISAK